MVSALQPPKNHSLFLMTSLTFSLTCPDIQDLKMTFHLAASDAATAIFVVGRTAPPYTIFKCLTRYTALPEWDFEKVVAFEETRDDASHLNCVVMVRRRPKVYLLKLASFSTVPNYISLLAFIFPSDEFGARIGILLTLILALTGVVRQQSSNSRTCSVFRVLTNSCLFRAKQLFVLQRTLWSST